MITSPAAVNTVVPMPPVSGRTLPLVLTIWMVMVADSAVAAPS